MARWWRSDMRVNPGESYADMIDHAAEREYEFERAIDRIETLARERAALSRIGGAK